MNTYTNIEAEQTVLGSILINSTYLKQIKFLKVNDFYNSKNRLLYKIILNIVKRHHYVYIIPFLKKNRKLNMFGGMNYFNHLIASVENAQNVKTYATLIHHLAELRSKHNDNSKKRDNTLTPKALKKYQEPLLLANLIALGSSKDKKSRLVNPNFNYLSKDLKPKYFHYQQDRALFNVLSKINQEHKVIKWGNITNYLEKHHEYGLIRYVSQIMMNTNLSLNVYYLAYHIERDAKESEQQKQIRKNEQLTSNNNKKHHHQSSIRSNNSTENNNFSTELNLDLSNKPSQPDKKLINIQEHHSKLLKAIQQDARIENNANNKHLKKYKKETKLNPHVTLKSPIDKLYGVSHLDAIRAGHLEVHNIHDLLVYFPFRYEDITVTNLHNVKNKMKIQTYGKIITRVNISKTRFGNTRLYFLANLIDDNNHHQKVWVNDFDSRYNNMYQRNQNLINHLKTGMIVSLYGTLNPAIFNTGTYPSITVYTITPTTINDAKQNIKNGQVAMYGVYKGSPQHNIPPQKVQHLVYLAYQQCHYLIKNNTLVPKSVRARYRLEPEVQVVHNLHFPLNRESVKKAQRTAKFNEFFAFELKLQRHKAQHNHIKGTAIHYHKNVIQKFIKQLPYKLTKDQVDSVQDVLSDLSSHRQMKRLLQGDVGSGKTVVSMVGILATINAGYQCALMCPTSILAKQHYQSFKDAFKNFNIKVSLLIGSLTLKQRNKELKNLKNGKTNLVIGTSALMQPKIHYHNLAMAVIDEQHRFGVNQRNALRNKGNGVNILSMTATPIPRTMALSSPIYSQLDTSRIMHLPGGRKRTITKWTKDNNIKGCLPIIKKILHKHEQAFIVTTRIKTKEDQYQDNITKIKQTLKKTKPTDKAKTEQLTSSLAINQVKLDNQEELNSVDKLSKELEKLLPKAKIGVLDGSMNDNKKNKIMNNFANGKYQILVSTTVVEVGIDIANACLMIIMNADRYGLATLHQLRGRVGRSDKQAYCILSAPVKPLSKQQKQQLDHDVQNVHSKKHKASLNVEIKHLRYLKHHGVNGVKRMHVMCSTTDGFKIANADMKLRGSGNLLGQQQSGMPNFKIGNPVDNSKDQNIMYWAERIANHVINKSME